MSYSRELARYIHELRFEDTPLSAVNKTKDCFLDWFGAIYNSASNDLSEKYVNSALSLGGQGEYSIPGRSEKTSLLFARLRQRVPLVLPQLQQNL